MQLTVKARRDKENNTVSNICVHHSFLDFDITTLWLVEIARNHVIINDTTDK